ncbi:unnamed protein product [Closterium sp. Naga37s-1]|nr:unnamed protein product [Closterium sp. Naga37s-1]
MGGVVGPAAGYPSQWLDVRFQVPAPATATAFPPPPAVAAPSALSAPLVVAAPPTLSAPALAVRESRVLHPVAQTAPAPSPLVQYVVAGSAPVTAVDAGPDSAHKVFPESAPLPQAAPPSETKGIRAKSENRAAAVGGKATFHWGRDSPCRRPSPSYRSAHCGGHGGWRGGHGRDRDGVNEVKHLRPDLPGMLATAMRSVQVGSSSHIGWQSLRAAPIAPPPVYEHFPAPAPVARPVAAVRYPDLPWIPPVAGMGFVGVGGGEARVSFVPPRLAATVPPAAPPPSLPDPGVGVFAPQVQVPTTALAQLWRLVVL